MKLNSKQRRSQRSAARRRMKILASEPLGFVQISKSDAEELIKKTRERQRLAQQERYNKNDIQIE